MCLWSNQREIEQGPSSSRLFEDFIVLTDDDEPLPSVFETVRDNSMNGIILKETMSCSQTTCQDI